MKTIFVYGTLMKGQYNHCLIDRARFIGKGVIRGYEMYDCGSFPAIVSGRGLVFGEVYSVDNVTLENVDRLESNGFLYQRSSVAVELTERAASITAEVYIYLDETIKVQNTKHRIWEYLQPYGCDKNERIWYVAYGSNKCKERFMRYINGEPGAANKFRRMGCRDKTPPADDKGFPMHYELYYGAVSGTWGGKGVAFLDKDCPNNVLGRAWLITRGQLHDLHRQEGWSSGWYDTVLYLRENDGIPAYTITNHERHEDNPPSGEYLAIIKRGEAETWGDEARD